MRKLTKKLLIVILSTFMLFGLTMSIGCNCGDNGSQGNEGNFPSTPITAEVSLSATNVKMIVGDYYTIFTYTNKAPGLTVELSSEDESVATVDAFGSIEAINEGTTNIVAKYGDVTAKCAVTVEFDDSLPEVVDLSALDSEYVLYKGESFTFNPAIKYRGRIYTDGSFNFTSTNDDVAYFDDFTLTAKDQVSVVNCYVEGSWRGFDASNTKTLRKDFAVNVMVEAYISLQGTSEDVIELYTHETFGGVTYKNSNDFVPEFFADGEKIENVDFDYDFNNGEIVDLNGEKLTAKHFGQTQIDISCTYQGIEYIKTINVNILRPTADYDVQLDCFSTGLGTLKDENDNYTEKTIANRIYGNDEVEIIEAYQSGKSLVVEDNKILGVQGDIEDAFDTVVTIVTTTEVYNVALRVYGLYIMRAEDLGYFSLYPKYTDYYYVACDIDATGYAMPLYGNTTYGVDRNGLMGTFEGNGHVIKGLTVNSMGIFGALTGGTLQNIAFTNVILTGYYPCLLGHWEIGEAKVKNLYAQFDDVALKGGCLYQQKFSVTGIHENVVVEYGISADDVISRVVNNKSNDANISTYAPQRGQTWSQSPTMFKNCFSISYAPIGLSEPRKTDYSWTSYVVAENQVKQTENTETGRIDLEFIDDFEKELLPHTGFTAIKKVEDKEDAIEVAKGIKAYHTIADMQADKEGNAKILESFDSTYWVVENGVPYWKGVYVGSFEVSIKNGEIPVEDRIVLSNDTTELTITIVDSNGNPVETTITGVEGVVVNGNKVRLATAPTGKGSYEITATAIVNGIVIEKVITIGYSDEIQVNGTILYSADDKALDLDSLNKALALVGVDEITLDDIDLYDVKGVKSEVLELEVIISNNTSVNKGRNRSVDVAQQVTIVVDNKSILLNNVFAYTKLIDEAEDFKYFTLKGASEENSYNEVNGYFLVTKNIDASELVLDEHKFMTGALYPDTQGYSADVGFRGVLDGQGYTIDGLTTKSSGIFGNANAPIVKNIAFTNVSLTGYYKTLFATNIIRGKNYTNNFTGYEAMFKNVYISVNFIGTDSDNNVGILAQRTFPAAILCENVIVDYLNVSSGVQSKIEAGKSFYMFGASGASMASEIKSYKNCYAISTAPVLQKKAMPGFAENQVEFTLSSSKVTAVSKALDEQVNEILTRFGKTLSVDYVLVGVKAYKNYASMKSANNDYSSFSANYWTMVDGIPVWTTAN